MDQKSLDGWKISVKLRHHSPKLQNIEVPVNFISILQSLDIDVINCFKGYYRRRLDSILKNIEIKVEESSKAVDVKGSCDNIAGRVTEEDILFEITDEMKNDDEENDDPSHSLLTSQEALQSVQSLRAFSFKLFTHK
ncbi:hypothetical protein AVEN_96572-1 [Araneus ventricosus]|uniref:Uncharacterized protein n=1 Tax=Araneus ventricosus TaxID=182803 RepID=A0A4Y2H748_ARAVE|nr:hypothetical protein AVEN_96572-1 [Araneus ventricosus]